MKPPEKLQIGKADKHIYYMGVQYMYIHIVPSMDKTSIRFQSKVKTCTDMESEMPN
jgi:hypothetical protein